MEDKLVEILALLEKDLKDIDSAVKHLSKSQEAVQALVDSNSAFTTSFREHMGELQKQVKDVLNTLKAETKGVTDQWARLTTGLANLVERLGNLTSYFESVNFPARLDKLDTAIATLQQGILSNQTLLNDIYRRIDQHAEKQSQYSNQLIKQSQQLKTFAIAILGLVCVGIAIGLFGILIK
jgi:septation ring formation regulator EzrA